jgi:hypothetical protein
VSSLFKNNNILKDTGRADQPNLKSFSPGALGSGKPNQIKLLQYDSLAQKLTA